MKSSTKEVRFGIWLLESNRRLGTLVLPHTSCVTRGMLFNLPEPLSLPL